VVKAFGFPITRDDGDSGDVARSSTPTRHFSTFIANKALIQFDPWGDPCVTLGWPLGHAWATQGPPNPNPNQAEGHNPKMQKPSFQAGYQNQNCGPQRPSPCGLYK